MIKIGKTGIYSITNIWDGKKYIGQTVNLIVRPIEHFYKLQHKIHQNKHFQAAFDIYGVLSFEVKIIEEIPEEKLDERERYWIKFYKSNNPNFGYNKMDGGCKNHHHSEISKQLMSVIQRKTHALPEVRARISVGNRNRSAESRRGQADKIRGRFHTFQSRQKMSMSQQLAAISPEARKKKALAFLGKQHTSKTLQQMSQTRTKQWQNPAIRQKMITGMRGKKRSPETCLKISQFQQGKVITKKTCGHMALGQQRRRYTEMLASRIGLQWTTW